MQLWKRPRYRIQVQHAREKRERGMKGNVFLKGKSKKRESETCHHHPSFLASFLPSLTVRVWPPVNLFSPSILEKIRRHIRVPFMSFVFHIYFTPKLRSFQKEGKKYNFLSRGRSGQPFDHSLKTSCVNQWPLTRARLLVMDFWVPVFFFTFWNKYPAFLSAPRPIFSLILWLPVPCFTHWKNLKIRERNILQELERESEWKSLLFWMSFSFPAVASLFRTSN